MATNTQKPISIFASKQQKPAVPTAFNQKKPTTTQRPSSIPPTPAIFQGNRITPPSSTPTATKPAVSSTPASTPGGLPNNGSAFLPIKFHDTQETISNLPKSTPGSSYTPSANTNQPTYSGGGGYYGGGGGSPTQQPTQEQQTPTPEAQTPRGNNVVLTPEQQQSQAETIQSVDGIMSGYQQLAQDARNMGNEGLLALAAQWDKMVQTLDSVQAQITQQIQGQMNGDDPAMQSAIGLIRQEADKMRQETLEELNARGLVQSGVYAKALSDMNNNTLTQIQSAVASRFGDLQTQLNSAIMSLAQTRIGALSANQSAVASMMGNTQNNVLSAGLAGLNAGMTARGQDIQSNQFNQTLDFNRDQLAQSNKQFYDQLSQQDKQFYDQLSQNEKLAVMSRASSGGGSASDALEWAKFEFSKQQYSDGIAAGNDNLTYQQIGQAFGAGGTVEQMVGKIKNGSYTVGQVRNMINNGGYTSQAASQILNAITSDAGVQKKISTPTKPSKNISAVDYAKSYTPSIFLGKSF